MRLIRSDSRETLGRLYLHRQTHRKEQARGTGSPFFVDVFSFPLHHSVEFAGNIMVTTPIALRKRSITFDLGPV